MNSYHVLYTSNKDYFSHMLTSILSLLENNKNISFIIHIIEDDFTINQIQKLYSVVEPYQVHIKIYSIKQLEPFLEKYHVPNWRGTNIANARLFAHEILDVDQLLYLDSDTVITNELESLFKRKANKPLSAVKEIFIPSHISDYVNQYFNSGVILFDYNSWEKEDCSKKLYDAIKLNKIPLKYPDQDIINFAFQDSIASLDMSYNINAFIYDLMKYDFLARKKVSSLTNYYTYNEILESLNKPYIYHMLSYLETRPWKKNRIYPFNSIYEKYRKLWDSDFQQEKIDNFLANISFVPFLNILKSVYLEKIFNEDIKNKVKQIIKKR